MIERQYTPISVVFVKKGGRKKYIKTFTTERCPDTLITNKSTRLPLGCEILDLGVGSSFEEYYKKKHKIK